jgi:hypothetical protein
MSKAHGSMLLLDNRLYDVFIIEHINREPLHFLKVVFASDLQTHEEYATIPYRYFKCNECRSSMYKEISQAYFEHIKQLIMEGEKQ